MTQYTRFKEKTVNVAVTTDAKKKLDAIQYERQKDRPIRLTLIGLMQELIDEEYSRLGLDNKEGE